MFKFQWFKKKELFKSEEKLAPNPISWFDQHVTEHQNLIHPVWEQVYKRANNLESVQEPNELWCDIARTWMSHLVDHLPIPLWLNEGMAVNLESVVKGVANYHMN